MPEIQSEIPDDVELAAYLDEWLKTTAACLLTDYPENERYYHSNTVDALSYLSAPSRPEFLTVARNTLFESLRRLNGLPRSDPFWHNTNRRPTIFKVTDFSERLLRENPNHMLSLWTLSALSVLQTGEFGRGRWIHFYRLSVVQLWMVAFAAMLLEVAGSPTAFEFSELVKATGSEALVGPVLRQVSQDGGLVLSEWSRSVATLLASA